MDQSRLLRGIAALSVTIFAWGATFPIAKSALVTLDGFWATAIRYFFLAPVFLAILYLVEGRGALGYDRRFRLAAVFGTLGFAGFNLFSYVGLQHTLPENAAIINTLQAPMTALAHWAWRGVRPARFTVAAMVAAIAGVALVVTKGDPAGALAGGSLFGDLLCLAGGACWVGYILGVVKFHEWSSLRYSALTCVPGTFVIFLVTATATAAGVAHVPAAADVSAVSWQLAYLVLFTGVVGVLFWNRGVQLLGPLNAILLGNLIPVVTFAIRVGQGHRFAPVEIAGAALVIAALAANNLHLRRKALAGTR
ncbi:MAG: DMT family transporter [Burkholderiales bacterium]|nr:DMT family transporter [Burkholderiales bacterium]